MELTQKIPHPKFPGFVTTIKFVSRADVINRSVEIENMRVPMVAIDPRTGEAYQQKNGEPLVVWKIVSGPSAAAEGILRYVVGFEGYPFDGGVFDPKTVATMLLDERLDIEVQEPLFNEIGAVLNDDGSPKVGPVKRAWSRHLGNLAIDRETFIPGFTGTHSEAP